MLSVASVSILIVQVAGVLLAVVLLFIGRMRLRAVAAALLAALVLLPCVSFMRLNPDSYLYVLLSSGYLQRPLDFFRVDAGTVGQIVPGVLAALRAIGGARAMSDPIAVSKFLQYLFYGCVIVVVATAAACIRWNRRSTRATGSMIAAASLLLLLATTRWSHPDFHSYNGEAVAIALASVLAWLAFRPASVRALVLRGVLAGLAAYVKAQALPVVLLLLLMRNRRVGVRGRRVNERLGVLAVSAATFLCIESAIALLGGQTFLGKIPVLLRYASSVPGGVSAADFPDFAQVFPDSATQSRLTTLLWALSYALHYLPSIALAFLTFGALYVANPRLRQAGRPYLTWATFYLAVATFAIVLPGNLFHHYLLLLVPVVCLLARGFSVAGSRLRATPTVRIGIASLVLLICAAGLVRNREHFIWQAFVNSSGAVTQDDVARVLPSELIAVLRRNVERGTPFLLHGFDSELYVYAGAPRLRLDLGLIVTSKTRNLRAFCDYAHDIDALGPHYIVDAVAGKWGFATQEALQLERNPSFKAIVLRNYRLAGVYSGIPLYERTGTANAEPSGVTCGRAAGS